MCSLAAGVIFEKKGVWLLFSQPAKRHVSDIYQDWGNDKFPPARTALMIAVDHDKCKINHLASDTCSMKQFVTLM